MDDLQITKWIIKYICFRIVNQYKKGQDFFTIGIDHRKAYIIADKGIEKRIQKKLFKTLGVESLIQYELSWIDNLYPSGELIIKIFKAKEINNEQI